MLLAADIGHGTLLEIIDFVHSICTQLLLNVIVCEVFDFQFVPAKLVLPQAAEQEMVINKYIKSTKCQIRLQCMC